MTSPNRRRAIIKDLLALYQRYGFEEIEQAALSLKSGEALSELVDLTLLVSKGAKRASDAGPPLATRRKKKSQREYLSDLINDLESTSDPSFDGLIRLLRSASKGAVLNDGRSLREFVGRLDIPDVGPKLDRFAILRRIGEVLRTKPVQERADLIEIAKRFESGPSSLQGWSDLIVKK